MMDKSVKINLAGTLFQIDEEAYHKLRDYLQALNNRFRNVPGGNETIEDIESRISEIFQSQGGNAGVVTKENVEAMISIIGKPEDFGTNEQAEGPHAEARWKKRLYRNPDERIISGVCGGIGSYLNIDPVWVRLIFILFTFTFGIGFLVYIALWVALPVAFTDSQKRELYGEAFHYAANGKLERNEIYSANPQQVTAGNIGNVFNEIFTAIGKFFYVIFRIFAIAFGIIFVIFGFVSMLTFLLVLFVRNQGFLPLELHGNFFYLPDFLNFVVNPALTPWICMLISMVVLLPLLAVIYWGIKMIFWFRSRDGVISLVALVLWFLSLTALVVILAGQGLSFSETGRATSSIVIGNPPDTLYIVASNKITDLKYTSDLIIPDDSYSMYANRDSLQLSIRANLRIETSGDKSARVEVTKSALGTGRIDASRRAESLPYNFRISRDTLYMDEYFTLPKDHRWSGDDIYTTIYVPDGTVIWFDNTFGNHRIRYNDQTFEGDFGKNFWVMSSDGLKSSGSLKDQKEF
jgi:phage shock protein PspC (stress-responsive transcriptional regulator)